jgi:cell division cycle protein 20 (cofactor of APC complex)
MSMEACQFQMTADEPDGRVSHEVNSPKAEYQRVVQKTLMNEAHSRILTFKEKPPTADPVPILAEVRGLFTQNKAAQTAKVSLRYIPQSPDRVLDAPEFRPDFYLNLVDWSSTNVVAVALGDVSHFACLFDCLTLLQTVYLWNASSGAIQELCRSEQEGDYVCSVSWVENGSALAIGYANSTVQIWDVTRQKRVRTLHGHDSRVAALAWNGNILTTGCKNGAIFNHDVCIADHHVATMQGHTQEVCGLKWSPDGKFLARFA